MQWQRIALSVSTFRFPVLTRLGGIHKSHNLYSTFSYRLDYFQAILEKAVLPYVLHTYQNQAFPILFFTATISFLIHSATAG